MELYEPSFCFISCNEVLFVGFYDQNDFDTTVAVIFDLETLSSRIVLEADDEVELFSGDMRYLTDGQVLVYDYRRLGKITYKDQSCTFELLSNSRV